MICTYNAELTSHMLAVLKILRGKAMANYSVIFLILHHSSIRTHC